MASLHTPGFLKLFCGGDQIHPRDLEIRELAVRVAQGHPSARQIVKFACQLIGTIRIDAAVHGVLWASGAVVSRLELGSRPIRSPLDGGEPRAAFLC